MTVGDDQRRLLVSDSRHHSRQSSIECCLGKMAESDTTSTERGMVPSEEGVVPESPSGMRCSSTAKGRDNFEQVG